MGRTWRNCRDYRCHTVRKTSQYVLLDYTQEELHEHSAECVAILDLAQQVQPSFHGDGSWAVGEATIASSLQGFRERRDSDNIHHFQSALCQLFKKQVTLPSHVPITGTLIVEWVDCFYRRRHEYQWFCPKTSMALVL